MALDGIVFDVDGTLLDTNAAHVEGWQRAFATFGYRIPADRIAASVGQGGDRLIVALLGATTATQQGRALREASAAEFVALLGDAPVRVFPGVRALVAALRRHGVRTALGTSSSRLQLAALLARAGLALAEVADAAITSDDVVASKPAPDTILAAVRALGLPVERCAYVGDTPYDAEAARAAGVTAIGMLTGVHSAATLRAAGAERVYADPAALLADLDAVLGDRAPAA